MNNLKAPGKGRPEAEASQDEVFYRAGQWQLVWWKFRRHKLAQVAMVVLAIFYLIVALAEFVSPHAPLHRYKQFAASPPTKIYIRDDTGRFRRPFIHPTVMERDPVTFRPLYVENREVRYPIGFLCGAIHTSSGVCSSGTFTS